MIKNIITRPCDKCGTELKLDGDKKTTFGGIECTEAQYIELAKGNPNIVFVCKECLDKMEDAWPYFESGEAQAVPTHKQN